MLASDILIQSRYILSDQSKDRWSDERLLSLLNTALRDVAKNTTLFTENMFYQVSNLVVDIDLTDRAIKVLRAEYLDQVLPFYSFEEMDRKDKNWQTVEGDKVEAIVYNEQRSGLYKQYPIVTNALNPNIEYTSLFGVVTDISYSDIAPVLADVYGDIAHIPDEALIKFYYIRKHEKVLSLDDEIIIDDLLEQPLVHYITGKAFRDNQDAQNRALGQEELQLYYNMLKEYTLERSTAFARPDYVAEYRPND